MSIHEPITPPEDEGEVKTITGVSTPLQSWKPTRKWFAALVTGAASIVATTIITGGFDGEEQGQLGALALALLGAYVKSNAPTPGGVE